MKRFLYVLLTALVVISVLSFTAYADDSVAYIAYNTGSNANDGLTDTTPKQGLGTTDGTGAAGLLKKGGTLVVCGKLYLGTDYAWNLSGAATITANYGGKDYKNTEPVSNPASGVLKMKPGATFTVASDLTLDDIILFQENTQCTVIVTSGATFTVNESVITMSNKGEYMKIVVTEGATAIINGGTFASVSGEGNIVIGEKATVLGQADENVTEEFEVVRETTVCYLDYVNGNNSNDGTSADKAVKSYGSGVFKRVVVGGTVVVSGNSYIGGTGANNEYSMPTLPKPLTFTSVYGGVDYKTSASFRFSPNTTFNISSDVIFDNIVLLEDKGQTTIRVSNGATLTVTDKAVLRSSGCSHYKIIVDAGAIALLSEEAQKKFTVTGEGTVITYTEGSGDILNHYLGGKRVVELTIGSNVAYINGVANNLDAAPINRNNRTMLPVRFLANAFGIVDSGIKWDAAARTATLTNESVTIVVTIDAASMTVNGETVTLDSPAVIENNRTYLPVRAIANALGVLDDNIAWDAATNTATLVK